MTKWEYEVNILPNEQFKIQRVLNDLGAEGWKLVAFNFDMGTAIFERPVPESIREAFTFAKMEAGCGCTGADILAKANAEGVVR